jgi:dsDNA-specific endonuclease/ATPase MutS2
VRSFNKIGSVQEVIKNPAGEITLVVVNLGSMKVKVNASELEAELEAVSGKVKKSMLHEERASRLRSSHKDGAGAGAGNDRAFKDRTDLKGARGGAYKQDGIQEKYLYVRTQANTLDLRGKRVEEALSLLEQFVDGCALGRVTPFMVIHGHGTGAVKSAVREYLGSMRYPGEFRPGEVYEGGDGVTVVDLTD